MNGFTLLEILIVIGFVAVLCSFSAYSSIADLERHKHQQNARTQALHDAASIVTRLQRIAAGSYLDQPF